jgi:[NiFe] hydrogenase large subunit
VARTVVDPLTRIEGHLRVECEVEDGVITDAWVSGTLYRGMETILKGRQPTDAYYISQRICGVCPISHGHASTMSAEDSLDIQIPEGARLVRNIIEGAQYLHSHILWFYTLAALDYIDPSKALEADIAATYDLAEQAGTTTSDFKAVQDTLQGLVDSGNLSIFTNGWFGHPAYAQDMPPELALIAVAHYLEALEAQAAATQIIGIMGGKFPHFMTSIPGGTAWVPTEEKLDDVLFRLRRVRDFVWNTMIPDTLAIAPFYLGAAQYGGGYGSFLAWGVFDRPSGERGDRYLPDGVTFDRSFLLEDSNPEKVLEYIDSAWYSSGNGLNPSDGETVADFTEYDTDDKYTWAKAPRYEGKPCEVGPLARMLVAYLKGVEPVKDIVDTALTALGVPGQPELLVSLLGRVAARNLETAVIADWMVEWIDETVAAVKAAQEGTADVSFFTSSTNEDGSGAGLWEAPRGALGHWMTVDRGRIENYQVITPSTWNIGGRGENGDRGAIEEALVGAPVLEVERPLEACRIVRSFDP